MPYIAEPNIIKPIDKLISLAEKRIGQKMMPARLLLWSPKAFISSMILEGLISHSYKRVTKRMLKLIRMQVSLAVACPFCIDMNASKFRVYDITEEEIQALQGLKAIKATSSFTNREKLVLMYVRSLVSTPIRHPDKIIKKMTEVFTEREFTVIVTTVAQVDYWTRIIQGFGIQPAGFLDTCDLEIMTKSLKPNV